MALTCPCTCRTIREDNSGAQENRRLSRNRSPWNLVKLTLFILVTISGALPVIIAGGMLGYRQNTSVIPGMIMYAMLWAWFTWFLSKTYLINWCPTCSNKCRIDTIKELASLIFRRSSQPNLWRNCDLEAPPPPRAVETCTICSSIENLQGNRIIWKNNTFERCGHRFHSRCLMERLIQQRRCPVCFYNSTRNPQDIKEEVPPRAELLCSIRNID